MRVPVSRALLSGRYRLDEVIGRGGMSTVYRATDEVLGRTVAVKILLATLADQDPTYAARFEREARAAAALDDPSVVTVYDTGADDGSHYIVMEYIAGRSLEQLLGDGAALGVAEATRIAAAVAGALASAHAAGILHRDIKPANVMLTEGGDVKVLDFGIARNLDGTTITQVASVVGTAAYMAPERALGQAGDARSDIYSLGCLLYAMLTGGPPFEAEVSAAVLHQQINASPRPPSTLRTGIPSALDALVLGMLAKAADERPGSAAQVHDALLGQAGGPRARIGAAASTATTPLTAATTPLTAATPPLTAATTAAAAPRSRLATDHRRRAVVMALLTGLLTLIAVALLSGGSASEQAGPAAGSRHAPVATPSTTKAGPAATTQANQPPPSKVKAGKPNQPKPKATPIGPAASGPAVSGGAAPGQGGEPPGQAKKNGDGGGGD